MNTNPYAMLQDGMSGQFTPWGPTAGATSASVLGAASPLPTMTTMPVPTDSGYGSLGDWSNVLGGIYNMYQGGQTQSQLGSLKAVQGSAANQLQALLSGQMSVTQMPGYQASQDAAMQALTRQLASQGLTGSGTAAQAIATEGAQFQHQYYMDMLKQLGVLSGADNPYAGMQMMQGAAGAQAGGLGQILGGLGDIWNILGGEGGAGDVLGSIGSVLGGLL